MKTKLMQISSALILPIAFIVIFIVPFASLSKYGFGGILVTAIALLLTYGFVKKDGKTLRDIGFSFSKNTPINFLKGLMIGCLVAITMFAIILTLSELQISFNEDTDIPSVMIWLLAFFHLHIWKK